MQVRGVVGVPVRGVVGVQVRGVVGVHVGGVVTGVQVKEVWSLVYRLKRCGWRCVPHFFMQI